MPKRQVKKTPKKKPVKQSKIGGRLDAAFDTEGWLDDTDAFESPQIFVQQQMQKFAQKVQQLLESGVPLEKIQKMDVNDIIGPDRCRDNQNHSPQDKAHHIMLEAFEAGQNAKGIKFARKALELDPDNVDARMFIAVATTRSDEELIPLCKEALQIGKRVLGKKFFTQHTGSFGRLFETRPYMRALQTLGDAYRRTGNLTGAAETYKRILRLNSDDGQGIRYTLICLLLEMGADADAKKLYDQFHDDYSAWWAYSKVLIVFRKRGDSPQTKESLREALKVNKHVPALLLEETKRHFAPPDFYGMGDVAEAKCYVLDGAVAWDKTVGALEWLKMQTNKK